MIWLEDLRDKAVLVTGASTGIGAATARAFARCGARVALHCNRGTEAADAVADDIQGSGGTARVLRADVTDTAAVTALVDEAAARLEGLDILVNNAGGLIRRMPVAEFDDEAFDAVIALNCRAVAAAARAAIPHLRRRGGGSIINTGSIAAHNGGGPGAAIYAGAKGFVHTLTYGLAKELAPEGIRVNCVAPGVIETPFHAATPPETLQGFAAQIPLKRLGTPEDCAGCFLFLASDAMSGYVTGHVLDVNGGMMPR